MLFVFRILVLLVFASVSLFAGEPAAAPQSNPDADSRQQRSAESGAAGESGPAEAADKTPQEKPAVTIFPHSDTSRFWVSGQANFVLQGHPSYPSPYRGQNSLRSVGESTASRVLTLYTGVQLSKRDELLFDLEMSGGRGVSDALGLAGFTNLDVVRNPTLGQKPYLARIMYHHVFALSQQTIDVDRGPLALFTKQPARRLEFRVGKFGTADFFDLNGVASDSHLQFLNWTVDNTGTFDYAANTRGYTYGVMLEYQDRRWGLRFAELLMPKVANGEYLDADLARARSENIEFELRPQLLKRRKSTARFLSFVNHANMGDYRQSIARFLAGTDTRPTIENTRRQGAVKYGFGVNLEQELTRDLRAAARWGWNEGQHESFTYSEVDSTLTLAADLAGRPWKRKLDKIGLAFVTNGISRDHQQYLRLGGLGFLLGDGNLNYGREKILEFYYTVHLWRGVFGSFDLQHINNPGYNRDRGPVLVPAVRLHLDL